MPVRKRLFVQLMILLAILIGGRIPLTAQSDSKDKGKKSESEIPPANAATLEQLIAQLGADSYQEREEAIRRLIAIGPPALGTLRRVADDKQADPDIRLRAARAAYAIATVKIDMVRRLGAHSGEGKTPSFHWATRVALAPDGKHAVSAGMDALRYWDLAAGKQIRVFGQKKNGYWSIAFSRDGSKIIAGARNRNAYLFDVNTGKQLAEMAGHTQEIWGVALTADGKQALTASWDHSIRVWDAATGKQVRTFKGVNDSVRCLALSPDGKRLAAGHFTAVNGPGIVRIWDVAKGTEVRSMKGHEMEITSISFSPDGKSLLTSSFDKSIRLWRVSDGKELKRFKGHTGRIECAAFTPDGKRAVSCADEGDPSLRLWEVSTGKQLGVSEPVAEGFLNIAALPDGKEALTTGKDGAVRLWKWTR